jgi:enolase-phosphatase E1
VIKAVVTDIEGTTTSLSFVKDVLFPYAREHIGTFLRQNEDNPEVAAQLDELRRLEGKELDLEDIIELLIQWIDEDRKITPLKSLQGMIWEAGYKSGDFTGHLYEDAARKMREWHERGIRLYVFSSGSVKAQKLIFGYSDFGDLTPIFSGYFDTNIGNKRETTAYRHIVDELGIPAEEILFLSDVEQELAAARDAGMKVIQLVREEQPAWPGCPQAANFDRIEI